MDFGKALEYVTASLTEKRLCHVLGCVSAAEELALRYGANVEKARYGALLHDITKEYTSAKQLKICEEWSIIPDKETYETEALLHAVTGAAVAQRMFQAPVDVVDAIRFHTTGRMGMTLLDKIVCLADYIEPNRVFPGVEALREKSRESLEGALIDALDGTIAHTIKKGGILHPDTILARNDLIREMHVKSCQ